MTRKTRDYIIMGVALFLGLALIAFVLGYINKNHDLNHANEQIKHKQTTIEQQLEANKELEAKLKEAEAQLESEKQAKAQLESENSQLKKEITELKAKKQAAVDNLIAAPQNPQPTGKICYLTFDDGPTDNTLKILETLKAANVKATFFVVNNAQTKIEYISQIHADGHTVGLHTASHNYAQLYSSIDAYYSDLNSISSTVEAYLGFRPYVIRFPGGGSNGVSRRYCSGIMSYLTSSEGVASKGYTYFDWNVDSGDASGSLSASRIANNVLQGARNKNSICVLMHDAVGKSTTADALPQIINGLREQGFEFRALTKESYGYHHSVRN